MEKLLEILGENLYGFWGVKATMGVWMVLVGLVGMYVTRLIRRKNR